MIASQGQETQFSSLHECVLQHYFEVHTLYQSKKRLRVRFSLRPSFGSLPLESASLSLAVEYCARELVARHFDASELTEFELSLHHSLQQDTFIVSAELGHIDDIFAAIQCQIHTPGRVTRKALASAFGTVKSLSVPSLGTHLSEVSGV
jgi:hypothetical protein